MAWETELRGIGPGLVCRYLVELGGRQVDAETVEGPGWSARVVKLSPARIGALQLGRTHVTIQGEPEALDRLIERFRRKVLRAGG